jgi:hypothetical protein
MAPALAPAPAPVAPPHLPVADHAALAAQVQAYASKHSAKAAKAKLAEYGYTGAQSVPAEYIPFMMQQLAV